MIDLIKKTLLAGVGAAVITQEKVAVALDDFVQQGKISSADARVMAEKIAADGRREFEALSQKLSESLHEQFAGIDRQATKRLDALEARVTLLESAAAADGSAAAKAEPASGG